MISLAQDGCQLASGHPSSPQACKYTRRYTIKLRAINRHSEIGCRLSAVSTGGAVIAAPPPIAGNVLLLNSSRHNDVRIIPSLCFQNTEIANYWWMIMVMSYIIDCMYAHKKREKQRASCQQKPKSFGKRWHCSLDVAFGTHILGEREFGNGLWGIEWSRDR